MESDHLITPLFFKTRDLADHDYDTYDVCEAVSIVTGKDKLRGAQRIRGLWRLYITDEDSKLKLLTQGLYILGTRVNLYTENPFTGNLGGESESVKLTIKDIPLSYTNQDITAFLTKLGAKMTSDIKFSKARDRSGALTDFLDGDRFVYLDKDHSLKNPLPRKSTCGSFDCRLIHFGQPSLTIKCSNCLMDGHPSQRCTNERACKACEKPGHIEGDEACEHYQAEPNCTTFAGPADPLSNFYQCEFEYSGIKVKSAEQAYQYKKAMQNGKPDIAKQILDTASPYEAKRLSKHIPCSRTWERENIEVMAAIVDNKFSQVPEAQDALLATADTTIVESVPGQFLWGSGLSKHATSHTLSSAWPGENQLGLLLTSTRSKLKSQLSQGHQSRPQNRSHRPHNTHRSDSSKRKLSDGSSRNQSPSRVRCVAVSGGSGRRPEYR